MRHLLLANVFLLVLGTSGVKAQDLEALNYFKYAIVETLFYDNLEVDKYSISGNVRKHFLEKGYVVVSETKRYWPDELFKNPCMGLYCHITSTAGLFAKYKVFIEMKDCNGRLIYSGVGKGVGETEPEAYGIATDRALEAFDAWNYQYIQGKMVKMREEFTNIKIEGFYDAVGASEGLKIQIKATVSRIEARVIRSNDKKYKEGQLLAVLERSSLNENLFKVLWLPEHDNTYKTLGSFEEESGRLIIELKEKGQTQQLVFRKIE